MLDLIATAILTYVRHIRTSAEGDTAELFNPMHAYAFSSSAYEGKYKHTPSLFPIHSTTFFGAFAIPHNSISYSECISCPFTCSDFRFYDLFSQYSPLGQGDKTDGNRSFYLSEPLPAISAVLILKQNAMKLKQLQLLSFCFTSWLSQAIQSQKTCREPLLPMPPPIIQN